MPVLSVIIGVFLVLVVLVDAFETVVLPRTVKRTIRLSNVFFQIAGKVYLGIGRIKPGGVRQGLLVAFAPLSLLILISLWALLMVIGWGLIHYGNGTPLGSTPLGLGGNTLATDLYFSGVTFLTLGYGDVVPLTGLGRLLAVLEAGLGFGFLALVVSYVPVLYSSFSRREVQMLLLDSRAGSNPVGAELIRRYSLAGCLTEVIPVLRDWERFGAELLESYLSYPLLAYYRSQHDNQSWLKSLIAVMDACSLIEVGFESLKGQDSDLRFQARATFAMARHVLVDLSYILDVPPKPVSSYRLQRDNMVEFRNGLKDAEIELRSGEAATERFLELFGLYEPYAQGLSSELLLELPSLKTSTKDVDNWQTSAWDSGKHF